MKTQYVYGLHRKDDISLIFYVGVTTRPKGRLASHIKSRGEGISMTILDEFMADDKAGIEELESMWMTLVERQHGKLELNKRRTFVTGTDEAIKAKILDLKLLLKDPAFSSHNLSSDQGEKMSDLLDQRYT